jgi:hypothetical protein
VPDAGGVTATLQGPHNLLQQEPDRKYPSSGDASPMVGRVLRAAAPSELSAEGPIAGGGQPRTVHRYDAR